MDLMRFPQNRQPLRLFGIWASVGWLLVAVVIYLSLTAEPIPTPGVEFGDKIGHFLAYFSLMFWFSQLYHRRQHNVLLILFIGMGVALEIVQSYTGYRSFQYSDMLANSAGALVGWLLAKTLCATLLLRFEQHFWGYRS